MAVDDAPLRGIPYVAPNDSPPSHYARARLYPLVVGDSEREPGLAGLRLYPRLDPKTVDRLRGPYPWAGLS